jgi:hypothetical protein
VLNAPEPRYRIIERDRRLITIDTKAGAAINDAVVPVAIRPEASPSPSPWQRETPQSSGATGKRSGRIAAVLAVSVIVLAFLILSGAWIVVAIALVIAPVRAVIWTTLKAAVERFVNG